MSVDGSAGASGALSAAKKLDVGESLEGGSVEEPGDPLTNAVLGQLASDHSVIGKLRDKAEEIRSEGRSVTREELREEAAAVMNSQGLGEDSVAADEFVERALSPGPMPDLGVVSERARELLSDPNNRPTESERKEIIERVEDPPPKPKEPPPKGAIEAYTQYRATFDWIEQNLGVKAHHVMGILWTETRLGGYTGKHSVFEVFTALSEEGTEKRKKRAVKQLGVLFELESQGKLGEYDAGSVRGSYAGALGAWQCIPTSCMAYGRSQGGGNPDPFNFEDAAVSAANYLKIHKYAESPSKSFFAYNHSQKYVTKVNENSDRFRPWIDELR